MITVGKGFQRLLKQQFLFKMARNYIENNFQLKFRNSLLKGIGKHLRKYRKISFQEYTVDNLTSDYKSGTLAEMQGIGNKTLQRLASQLKVDGHL